MKKGWIALRHFSVNEMIEALSLDRVRNAIQGLMAMTPDTATVQIEPGVWRDMPARAVPPGAIVRLKPGERVPLDGTVTDGQTTLNQAPITGESMPVAKQPGDAVFAGTINERGAIDYAVTARQSQSTLARIVSSMQQAQGDLAPTQQRFVDQFARYYIPAQLYSAWPICWGST